MEIRDKNLNEIHDFVVSSIWEIESDYGYRVNDIIICMPRYLFEYYKSTIFSKNKKGTYHYAGKPIQFSLDNSITVFYNHFNPNKIIKYTKQLQSNF